MQLKVSKKIIEDINDGKLERFGIDYEERRYADYFYVELQEISLRELQELHDIIKRSEVRGAKAAAWSIRLYLESISAKAMDDVKVKKVEYFSIYLIKHMKEMKRHHIYIYDEAHGCHYCYYINEIEYHPKHIERDYVIPEHVTVELGWEELGAPHTRKMSFEREDVLMYTVVEALSRKNMYFESSSYRESYEASIVRYNQIMGGIGKQYLVTGSGSDDVDTAEENRDHWRWSSNNNVILEREGVPTPAVIDVFHERDEEDRRHREDRADMTWWYDRLDREAEDGEEIRDELPIHPNVVIFSFKKFGRFKVHVDQLTEYEYDTALGKKLILPDESTHLIETLVSYEGGFQDIITNKGGGAIVLCAGLPGTGKTLTAEVYAEVMKRPLYTVQCSQLGIDPDDLEKSLQIVFSRAQRWNAILLLDEADVYVSERGSSLQQNAIVGVFLRVMEYYHGVMFMTTNRGDLVDDAVASRCIARIMYDVPTPVNLAKIWKVLAEVQGLKFAEGVLEQLTKKYPGLSGRDVKNLLKLAGLVAKGNKLTMETIDFVKKFKPTR